jgi:hypothetical protein
VTPFDPMSEPVPIAIGMELKDNHDQFGG